MAKHSDPAVIARERREIIDRLLVAAEDLEQKAGHPPPELDAVLSTMTTCMSSTMANNLLLKAICIHLGLLVNEGEND